MSATFVARLAFRCSSSGSSKPASRNRASRSSRSPSMASPNAFARPSALRTAASSIVSSARTSRRGRPGEGGVLLEPRQEARFDEPEPGDVILVRTGTQEGRGIGIVYRNDYGEQPHENDRIHVLWVNKKQASLADHMPAIGFSRVGRGDLDTIATAKRDHLGPPVQ